MIHILNLVGEEIYEKWFNFVLIETETTLELMHLETQYQFEQDPMYAKVSYSSFW